MPHRSTQAARATGRIDVKASKDGYELCPDIPALGGAAIYEEILFYGVGTDGIDGVKTNLTAIYLSACGQ